MAFSPPEVQKIAQEGYLPKPCDIWAMGISIYCLIFDRLPYKNINKDLSQEEIVIPDSPTISPSLKHAFTRLLDRDPQTRAKITEVVAMEWFFKEPEPEENK